MNIEKYENAHWAVNFFLLFLKLKKKGKNNEIYNLHVCFCVKFADMGL